MSFVLAVLGGVLAVASFPDAGWWPLIFTAFAPLMLALEDQPAGRRILLGWLFGVVFIAGKHFWIATTMVNLSGFPWWAAILSLIAYAGFIGGQWAVFAWGYAPLRRWSGRTTWVAAVPLFYALCELLWPQVFHLYISNALWEVPVLLQTAEWVGSSGVTWLIVLTSCTVVHVVEEYSRGRASDLLVPTAVAALWLIVSVWGVVRMQQVWEAPVKGYATVALIQPNVTVAEKRARDWSVRIGVYTRTVEMTRESLARRPDLVVWPEGGFPFVYEAVSPPDSRTPSGVFSRRLRRLALELGVPLVAGSLRTHDGVTRNSILAFEPGGREAQAYDKRELVPFGERVPFADTFPALVDAVPGLSHYPRGESWLSVGAAGFRWTLSLCYEAIQPHATREALNAGDGDVLLNLTNDVWFGPYGEPRQHLMAQIPRAIENRMWLVRSTNSGISAFIDPTGTIRARTEVGQQAVLAHELAVPSLPRTVYRRHGDILFWLSIALTLFWLVWRNQNDLRNFWRRRVSVRGSRSLE